VRSTSRRIPRSTEGLTLAHQRPRGRYSEQVETVADQFALSFNRIAALPNFRKTPSTKSCRAYHETETTFNVHGNYYAKPNYLIGSNGIQEVSFANNVPHSGRVSICKSGYSSSSALSGGKYERFDWALISYHAFVAASGANVRRLLTLSFMHNNSWAVRVSAMEPKRMLILRGYQSSISILHTTTVRAKRRANY